MKFLSNKNDLRSNLALLSAIIPARPIHPVLNNIKVVANQESQTLSLTGSDLNTGLVITFPVEVLESGSSTIPYKLFSETIGRFSESKITVESLIIESENAEADQEPAEQIVISSDKFRLALRTIAASHYPALPEIGDVAPTIIEVVAFNEALRNVTFAAASQEMKVVLTGVQITGSASRIEFAATDGHRLSVVNVAISSEAESDLSEELTFKMIIPAKSLKELNKIIARYNNSEPLKIYTDEKIVIFDIGNYRLSSRLLEGPFPSYDRMIPKEFISTATLDRKRLIKAIDLMSVLYSDTKNQSVKFDFDATNKMLRVTAENKELGKVEDSWQIEISGENTEVAFNGKYLIEGLKLFAGQDIQVQLNEGLKPVIFSPLGATKITYLVMPLQIRN